MRRPQLIRDLFPQAAAQLVLYADLWNREVDPGSADGVRSIYDAILQLEDQSQDGGLASLVDAARALRGDLLVLEKQTGGPVDDADLHALILATTLGPARAAVRSGRLNVAYDWLLWSLTTTWEVDGHHTAHFDWLLSVPKSQVDNAIYEILSPWLDTLYTYDWLTAGLPSMTARLAPQTLALAMLEVSHGVFDLAGTMLGWAGNRDIDPEVAEGLRRLGTVFAAFADDPATSPRLRAQALRPLALCSRSVTGQDQMERSRQLLDDFGDGLHSTDKLAALGNVYSGKPGELAENIHTFIELALDHHAQFAETGSAAAAAWARGAKHSLVSVPIRTLLLGGQVDAAMRLLRAWRGASDDAPRPRPVVGMLAGDHGIGWAVEGYAPVSQDTGPSLVDYQDVANAFFSTTVTVSTSPGMTITLPERQRGIPDQAALGRYLQTLEPFLNLEDAGHAHAHADPSPSSLLLVPTLQAPVQAMMARSLGWTLPLTTSLEQPAPDRPIQSAILYLGGSLFSGPEEEILTSILYEANIATTIRRDADLTRQQFREDYQSSSYDLVWVGTHGEFDGLQPDDTHLHLSSTERVHLDDLRPPASDTRRLLVLNACDGAVTAATAGVGEIGLAAYAAGSAQAVVSHLWPIESSTTALMFAGVLARSLVSAPNFFEAYQSTLKLLSGEPSVLRTHASTYSGRLANMVDEKSEELARMTAWGSAAFLE